MPAKFSTPNLRVWLAGGDGEPIDVQTTQADAARFDLARSRMSWPSTKDAPMLWANFLAWAALRREINAGKRPELANRISPKAEESVDAFDALVFLNEAGEELGEDAEDDALGVDPTQPTA